LSDDAAPGLVLTALKGIPLVAPGDDLGTLIAQALRFTQLIPSAHDVFVITSKIVSKAEGRYVRLEGTQPSEEAARLSALTGKDPRIVEWVLRESTAVSRAAPGVLVVRHRLGFVSANAGIDQSNIEDADARLLLLPEDPDASAAHIRRALEETFQCRLGVIISDSHGRPFRMGNVGVAIGVSGLPALRDLRGHADLFGRSLKITLQGYADMIASAAALLTGEAAEGRPVVHIRGLAASESDGKASDLVRAPEADLYRT